MRFFCCQVYNIYVGLGFKILNFEIFVGVTKNEYIRVLKYYDFYGFFFFVGGGGVTTKYDYSEGHSRVCFKVNVQNGNMWWGIVKLQIFLGMHDHQHKLEPSLSKSKVPPPLHGSAPNDRG